MRNQFKNVQFRFGWTFTPVVKILLWINGLAYLCLSLAEGKSIEFAGASGITFDLTGLVTTVLGLSPRAVVESLAIWQPITYLFLHANFWHFFLNMLGLWWFGFGLLELCGGFCSLSAKWNKQK